MFNYNHVSLGHCGPTLLLSHVGIRLHVLGARRLARSICSQCVVCRKAAAWIESQWMVHLELVSELTTEAFLAAMKRLVSRRGLPQDVHSDNGTNFIGAKNDHADLYQFLSSDTTSSSNHAYLLSHSISWHCIPERAPHFGGLWEAAVKSAKHHLRRVIGLQWLDFEEFTTILTQIEACLNSRPLCATTSHSIDGIQVLTPGHILIGRSLLAYPETTITSEPSLHKRWTLCQAITHHFWRRWSAEYLQHLQKAGKWRRTRPNLQPGDVVIVTDDKAFTNHWVLGKVLKVFAGKDGLVRTVDVQTETAAQPATHFKDKQTLATNLKMRTSILRHPIAKLALILPAYDPVPAPTSSTPTEKDGSDE